MKNENLALTFKACAALLAGLRTAGFVIARFALAAIVMAYSYEVVSGYFFDAPTGWSAELVSYLLCVAVFAMMPYVTAQRGHVAVTVLLERFDGRTQNAVQRLIWLVGFATCAAMTAFAADEVSREILRNVQMIAANPIPKWYVSSWIIFGFALSALEFLRLAICGEPALPETAQAQRPEI